MQINLNFCYASRQEDTISSPGNVSLGDREQGHVIYPLVKELRQIKNPVREIVGIPQERYEQGAT